MAAESNLDNRTFQAGQDLSSNQYYFVTLASDGQIDPTGNGAQATGILQNDPAAAGRAATVAVGGRSKVVAGTGGITVGATVASDANGAAVAAASGDVILGICREAAAAGEIGSVELTVPSTGTDEPA